MKLQSSEILRRLGAGESIDSNLSCMATSQPNCSQAIMNLHGSNGAKGTKT